MWGGEKMGRQKKIKLEPEEVKSFFKNISLCWAEIPGAVKVFFYSVLSSSVGLYLSGQPVGIKEVVAILAVNLGIWGSPKILYDPARKLEKKIRGE